MAVKDDHPVDTGSVAVFALLAACDFFLLLLCGKRLRGHFLVKEKYRPLLLFYAVLMVFLVTRIVFYLDIAADYPEAVYEALHILPTILIMSAASVISYIWIEIGCELVSSPLARQPFYFSKGAILVFISAANIVAYAGYIATFFSFLGSEDADSYMRLEESCLCFLMGVWQFFIGCKVEAVYRSVVLQKPKRIYVVKYVISCFFFARVVTSLFLYCYTPPMYGATKNALVFLYYFLLEFSLLLVLVLTISSPTLERSSCVKEPLTSTQDYDLGPEAGKASSLGSS